MRNVVAARDSEESRSGVYAIVRGGGRQHKVAVGDIIDIDKTSASAGTNVDLRPVLLVEDGAVTSDQNQLGAASVTAEVVGDSAGPKIRIVKFKNKTGYRKRQGHRQRYTRVKITGINN